MLVIEQELSYPGTDVNEDLVWHGPHDAVVLDGSSTLSGTGHDAVEFVRAFIGCYENEVAAGRGLVESVNSAISSLRERFDPSLYAEGIVPSAAGAFVRETHDALEVVSIADCTVVVLGRDGSVTRVRDCAIDRFDAEVIELAASIRTDTGMDIAETMRLPQIRSALLANRKRMNTPGGYRVLASNMEPIDASSVVRFDKDTVARVLVHSDGFDSATEGVSLASCDLDLEGLYRELRASERADVSLNRRPRFKVSDDASALLLRID